MLNILNIPHILTYTKEFLLELTIQRIFQSCMIVIGDGLFRRYKASEDDVWKSTNVMYYLFYSLCNFYKFLCMW